MNAEMIQRLRDRLEAGREYARAGAESPRNADDAREIAYNQGRFTAFEDALRDLDAVTA